MAGEAERAERLNAGGANCCQAVVAAFCEKYGLSERDALRLANGFGGGMRRGEICGAASGAVMVLGLAYGAGPAEPDAKAACEDRVREFMQWFERENGALVCRELLKAAGKKICPSLIAGAVRRLTETGL